MDFSYSEEQQMLQDSVSRFVQDRYGFEQRRQIVDSEAGFSADNWAMFAELGWLSVPFNEEFGGFGGSAVDLIVMMEQFGKGIVVEPFVATTVLAGRLLQHAAQTETIESIIEGSQQAAVAFAEPDSRYDLNTISTTAETTDQGYRLTGKKAVVLNADSADILLVSARTSGEQSDLGGISLFLVRPDADGVKRLTYKNVDGHGAAEVILDQAEGQLLGAEGDALPWLEDALQWATLAICAEAVGIMEILLQKTIDYARTRQQFGVPLAKFQALQHRMADMFIEAEQAKSILFMAAIKMDEGIEVTRSISAAKSRIGKAARKVGQEAVQLHGGIAITDEFDVGHYFKRLTAIESLFGSTDYHTRQFAAAG